MPPQSQMLRSGLEALKQRRYPQAIQTLEDFCREADEKMQEYSQAQIWLVKAYKGNGQLAEAMVLCQRLTSNKQELVKAWATEFLPSLTKAIALQATSQSESATDALSTAKPSETAATGMRMKTLNELKSFYQKNLLSELKITETKRQSILISITIVGVVLLLIVGLLIKFIPITHLSFNSFQGIKSSLANLFLFLLAITICLWAWVAFYTSSTETYGSGFKSKIIQKIIDFVDVNKSLNYSQYTDPHTTLSAFKHSQLFGGLIAPSKLSQSDCISGKISEIDVFLAEIRAEIEVSHPWLKHLDIMEDIRLRPYNSTLIDPWDIALYSIGLIIRITKGIPYVAHRMLKGQKIDYSHFEEEVVNNRVSRKTVFKGIFFKADFNKKFKGKTTVIPNNIGAKTQSLSKERGKLIQLEDPEFTKFFMVYGDDQIESRYILSTSLMARLVDFRKKANRKVYVSFVEDMIYMAIEYEEDLFEPRLFRSMLDFNPIKEYFENLQLMIGLVEDLNLNRRIWSRV